MATLDQIALWQGWLLDAQKAYHALMTGGMAVEVSVDGATFTTKFARPDADKLLAYMTRLEQQIAAAQVCGGAGKGAIGAFF